MSKFDGANFKVNKNSSDYWCGYLEGYRRGEIEGSLKAYERGIRVGKRMAQIEHKRFQEEIKNK